MRGWEREEREQSDVSVCSRVKRKKNVTLVEVELAPNH